jgi:transposase
MVLVKPATVVQWHRRGFQFYWRWRSRSGRHVDGNKNNAHDAAAICEASSRPSMRFVEPKTVAQQDLQALHRVREVAVHHCTLLANHVRGLWLEYGIIVGRGYPAFHHALPELLAHDEQRLSPLLKQVLAQQWRMLKLH